MSHSEVLIVPSLDLEETGVAQPFVHLTLPTCIAAAPLPVGVN